MALFERADTGKKVSWVSIIGLILIPLVIAGGFVAATWKVSDRMDSVKAVIVNDDDGAMMNGSAVPLGRQLVGGLMDDDTKGNYKWVLSDKEQAEEGMKSGEYVAAIYIPKDFSEDVMSGADQDNAADAVQATISVTTSKASPLSDGAISALVGNAARDKFNRTYAESYLNNIYLGFNQMGDGYGKLAKGAKGLAKGNKQFAKGIDGLGEGVTQLGGAGGKLAKGGEALGSAGGQLAANAPQLKKGGDKLGEAGGKLAKNAPQLKKGGDKLGDAGKQIAKGAPALKKGGDKLAKGGKKLPEGAKGIAEGAKGINSGLNGINTTGKNAAKAAAVMKDGQEPFPAAVKLGVFPSQKAANETKESICQASDRIADQANLPKDVKNQLCWANESSFLGGMSGGMTSVDQKDPKSGTSLLGASKQVAGGAGKFAKGLGEYTGGVAKYTDGVGKFADGAGKYGKGVGQYTDGVGKFADGVGQYGKGVGQYTDGVGKFADGVGQFGAGVSKYTGGVAQYTGGVQKLADGMPKLSKGADGLADGSKKFADGIDKAKDNVPHYSKADRKALKKNAASAIKVSNVNMLNKLPIAPTVALLLIMSLWLGALITYTVIRGVSASSLTSRKHSVVIMLKGLVPGAAVSVIQALGLTLLCQLLFKSDVVDFFSVLGFTMFAGIVYTVVNFALVALFGGVGRFISVALLALGIAANIISAVPGWLSGLAQLSPVTYGINGVTAIVTGADGLGKAYGLLLLWLVIGAVASIAAVARKRSAGFAEIQKMAHA